MKSFLQMCTDKQFDISSCSSRLDQLCKLLCLEALRICSTFGFQKTWGFHQSLAKETLKPKSESSLANKYNARSEFLAYKYEYLDIRVRTK